MNPIYLKLFCLLCFIPGGTTLSQVDIDSLEKIWHNKISEDSLRIKAAGKLATHYQRLSPDSALFFSEWEIEFAQKVNRPKDEVKALIRLGRFKARQKSYTEGDSLFSLAITKAKSIDYPYGESDAFKYQGLMKGKMGMHDAAIDLFQQGLTALEGVNSWRKSRLYNCIADTYHSKSRYQKSIQYANLALEANKDFQITRENIYALDITARSYWRLGDSKNAVKAFRKALAISRESNDLENIGKLLSNISAVYTTHGEFDSALTYQLQSKKLKESTQDVKGLIYSLNNLGIIYSNLGQGQKEIESLEEALLLAKSLQNDFLTASTLQNLGVTYSTQGNYGLALEYTAQALVIVKKLSSVKGQLGCLGTISNIYAKLGFVGRAIEYQKKRIVLAEEHGMKLDLADALSNLSVNYKIKELYDEALNTLEKSQQINDDINNVRGIAFNYNIYASIFFQLGEFDSALKYFEACLSLSEEIDLKKTKAGARFGFGRIAEEHGDLRKAIDNFQIALELAKQSKDVDREKESAEALYRNFKKTGNQIKAFEMLELAKSLEDSMQSEENQRSTYKYEYQQLAYQDSLEFLKQQQETELSFQHQLTNRNYLLFGGLGLALIIFLIYYFTQQRKTREKELRLQKERAERLEQIDKLKDQFLANTSHELRTPLNGIIGITEGLLNHKSELTETELETNLGMVVASGKRLASLVNDLLDFSRIRNADLVLRQRPTDIRSLADLVLQVSYPLTKGKDLSLQNEVPVDLPPAYADEDRLSQILHNLIGNAIKFTEAGHIYISAEQQAGKLVVAVKDTGIGIPEDKREIIFQEFTQADGSIQREFAGTGLGLSISKYLVEQHGGEMWVTSEVGEGSTFFFSLPLSPENIDKSVVVGARSVLTPLVPSFGDTTPLPSERPHPQEAIIKILIVDDEPINHQVLRNHLRDQRFEIHSAMHGQEALALIQQNISFDLVLLDIMMPRMSGYEVCQKIREYFLPSELPVILVTAKNQVADLVRGLDTGANDYLAKPFSKDEFLARMKTHLNLHQINRATSKFVPTEFIKTIGRDNIIEVQLGDNATREVTIFFSDIRGYTTLAEEMKPEENFGFINAYVRRMGPIIRENQGFINQYLGDGIMALFQQSPSDALKAAIEMQKTIQVYNRQRVSQGRQTLLVGMGLHTGPLVMGIIGDAERSDPAVIADTVNAAARLEGLTKYYGANILLSEDSFTALTDSQQVECRYLGKVQVKGRQAPMGIYECFGGDAPALAEQKALQQKSFALGMQQYLQADFHAAAEVFATLVAHDETDLVAKHFLSKTQNYLHHGKPENWEGIEKMTKK